MQLSEIEYIALAFTFIFGPAALLFAKWASNLITQETKDPNPTLENTL